MSLLVLTAEDVAKASASLSSDELIAMMGDVFLLVHTGTGSTLPQRIGISSSTHNTLFMPARIDRLGTAIKVVSVPTQKSGLGLPGTTLVLDEATGAARAVVNAGSLTAVRNAAGTIVDFCNLRVLFISRTQRIFTGNKTRWSIHTQNTPHVRCWQANRRTC